MKKIIICVITLLIVISTIIVINNRIKKNVENEKYELGNYYFDSDNESVFLEKICNKNGDWINLPLSEEFLNKYNEKDGIFGDMQFDKVEVNPYINTDENKYLSNFHHIVVTNKDIKYIYQYDFKTHGSFSKSPYYPFLDDVILSEPIIVKVDENENFDYKRPMLKSYKSENIYNLCDGDVYGLEQSVAITPHFKEKYPHFLDLFIHYSPLSFNKIKFIEDESDLDNNIAIFEVDSILECKTRKYKVKLILDDKLYLDDCEVEMLEEKAYDGNSKYESNKVFYINSNWDNLKLSEKFVKKYNPIKGIFNNISLIDINDEPKEAVIETNKSYISLKKFKDGSIHAYIRTVYIDDNDFLDDVTYEEIDYNGETLEELKNKYKNYK